MTATFLCSKSRAKSPVISLSITCFDSANVPSRSKIIRSFSARFFIKTSPTHPTILPWLHLCNNPRRRSRYRECLCAESYRKEKPHCALGHLRVRRSEEHTSELQS